MKSIREIEDRIILLNRNRDSFRHHNKANASANLVGQIESLIWVLDREVKHDKQTRTGN